MDPAADHHPALPDGAQRRRHQRPDRGEDDRGVELVRRRLVGAAGPGRPEAARQLKAWWAKVGIDRFKANAEGVFSYNLFGVSKADYARIEALQRAHFREIRNIVADSQPVETVAVVNLQLFSLLARPPLDPTR